MYRPLIRAVWHGWTTLKTECEITDGIMRASDRACQNEGTLACTTHEEAKES
jgi:hypothetical protein